LTNFHTFRQKFERANRNGAFLNLCNSEDGSVSYTCIRLLFSSLCGFNYANYRPDCIPRKYVLVPRIVHNVTRRIFPPIFFSGWAPD